MKLEPIIKRVKLQNHSNEVEIGTAVDATPEKPMEK
jgi:hypothetical protein